MERWTSRKLWVALLLVALATWMRWMQLLTESNWMEAVRLSIGGYFAANVGQQAVAAIAPLLSKDKTAPTAPVPPTQ